MGRIAVIDDSRADIQLIESFLRSAQHEVRSFQDVDDLEEHLAELAPDLVLLDIVMPNRNGFEILRSLKKNERTKSIPIVLVSTKKEPHDLAWGKRQGADGYLPKPFTSEELLNEVRKFIF